MGCNVGFRRQRAHSCASGREHERRQPPVITLVKHESFRPAVWDETKGRRVSLAKFDEKPAVHGLKRHAHPISRRAIVCGVPDDPPICEVDGVRASGEHILADDAGDATGGVERFVRDERREYAGVEVRAELQTIDPDDRAHGEANRGPDERLGDGPGAESVRHALGDERMARTSIENERERSQSVQHHRHNELSRPDGLNPRRASQASSAWIAPVPAVVTIASPTIQQRTGHLHGCQCASAVLFRS